MAKNPSDLLEEVLKLPDEARAALVASLLNSLDGKEDADVEGQWALEIAKRLDELDSGTVMPVPWAEARRKILERQ